MYTSHLGEDQSRDTHITKLHADDTSATLYEAESMMRTLVNRLNFGPDLDEAGAKALLKLGYALSLLEVAAELFGEVHEVMDAR